MTARVQSGADLRQRRIEAGVGVRELARALEQWPRSVEHVEASLRPRPATVERYLRALERVQADRRVAEVEGRARRQAELVRKSREGLNRLWVEVSRVLTEASAVGEAGGRAP